MKKYQLLELLIVIALGAVATLYSSHADTGLASTAQASPQNTTQHKVAKKGKVLVACFSVPETDGVDASSGASRVIDNGKLMGTTQYVANVISKATGGDLFNIKTVRTYPGTHQALIDAAKKEADSNARPKLSTHIKNLKDYDVVFVGFPNWWYDMPMPIYSFFAEYDFSGKTIIPFCTHGGSRFSDAIKTIRSLEKKATVLDGYSVSRNRVPQSKDGIIKWLDHIGLAKGK